jgi:acetyl esterase
MNDKFDAGKLTRKWLRRVAIAIAGVIIIAAALMVLGAHAPSIPYVVGYGSILLSVFPAWFLVLPLLAALVAWKLARGKARWVLVIPAALASVGAAVVVMSHISLGRAHDVQLSIGDFFGSGGNWASVLPDETVTYASDLGESLGLRIYRPPGNAPRAGWPVLMYVHGGGWIGGSNADRSADMRWFANHGWLAVSVGYSLSTNSRHLWDRVVPQIGCAMTWTAANIASRGGDPQRLALIGESAGGNLVLNAGYLGNAGGLQSMCPGAVPHVAAISAIYPGVDPVAIDNNDYPGTSEGVQHMVRSYTGGPSEQFPERYRVVASATHISRAAPRTLVFISEHDHVVPTRSMQLFVDEARRGGVAVTAVSVPYAEHGFDIAGVGNQIVRQVTLAFLNQHVPAPAQ